MNTANCTLSIYQSEAIAFSSIQNALSELTEGALYQNKRF